MTDSQSHVGQKMFSGGIRIFLAEALVLPTGLLTAAFLTRRLGPEGYGLLVLSATVISWVQWSVRSLFARTTIKLVGEQEKWHPVATTMLQMNLWVSCAAMILLWFLATPITSLFDEPQLAKYMFLYACNIPLFCLAQAYRNILVGIGSYNQRALASAGHWISRLILIVLLVESGLSVTGAILGSIGATIVELIIVRIYVRLPLLRSTKMDMGRIWAYLVPLSLSALSWRFYQDIDLFALKALGQTTTVTGFYGAIKSLTFARAVFIASFSPILLSTLSRLIGAGDYFKAKKIGSNAVRLVVGLLPIAGLIAGAAPEIVSLIFGRAFLPAASYLRILAFGEIAMIVISVTTVIITAAGKPKWTLVVNGVLVPLVIAGHILMIPKFGALGAAIVTSSVATLGALTATLATHRLLQIRPSLGTFSRSTIICVLAYWLSASWPVAGFFLFLKILLIGLLIVFTFLLLGEFSSTEIKVVQSLFRRQTLPD